MTYKVFLVEDEIVAREGIRDNVDWGAAGFDFCGEAPDGEIALPLIEKSKPDVLITDIKMPFVDGLQLSKIVREHMPWIKIIILSGHDEFEYAQTAIKIGVTEYLLKPVSAADILDVLKRVAVLLDQGVSERESLKQLNSQVEYNLQLRREQFLLRLVMGGISSGAAVEQGQQLGLNLIARHFLVLLITIELCDLSKPFDYYEYQRIERIVSDLAGNNADILLTKKDVEELVLILKGDDEEQLRQEGIFWAELIQKEKTSDAVCRLIIEMGSPQQRLSDIHRSFTEALVRTKNLTTPSPQIGFQENKTQIELQKIDHAALENYLKFGDLHAFDAFFESDLRLICESALQSDLVMHYLFLEIILTIAQFMSDLGDKDGQIVPEIREIEEILQRITTIAQIRAELRQIISSALVFRNNQVNHQRSKIIQQAKAYIDVHFGDPDIQMSQVAKKFNLSPDHFSTVFSQEIGESFRDYLNNLRINCAKELLRTTNLKCAEVAYRSGYNDAHYFSTFFKKKTGYTPQQFRDQPQVSKN
jgi:two-component system, response regulator YesN